MEIDVIVDRSNKSIRLEYTKQHGMFHFSNIENTCAGLNGYETMNEGIPLALAVKLADKILLLYPELKDPETKKPFSNKKMKILVDEELAKIIESL